MIARTKDAMALFHAGSQTLARIEANGIKIDSAYYETQKPRLADEALRLNKHIILDTDIGQRWKKRYGDLTNLDSTDQLKVVLDKDLKFQDFKITEKGGISADAEVIAKLPLEFATPYLQFKKLHKAYNSFIRPILREVDENGFLHANFNLHTVKTQRSSCTEPNMQQQPKRDKFLKTVIRSGFIPRSPDRCLGELDLKGAEVAIGACIHQDPAMLAYVTDDALDMHRDAAMDCFMLLLQQMSKPIRGSGKSDFVFPEFYGATFGTVAPAMWESVVNDKLTTAQGELVLDLLHKKGIQDIDDFTNHIKKVEDKFWNVRFKGYTAWKNKTYQDYLNRGYIDLITGFRITQEMLKTQLLNVPIQGPSFHYLLNCLIRMEKAMRKYKLKTCICGQIHDSMLFDFVPSEIQTIQNLYWDAQDAVRKDWDWITIDIRAEMEIAAPGKSWCDCKEIGYVERRAC